MIKIASNRNSIYERRTSRKLLAYNPRFKRGLKKEPLPIQESYFLILKHFDDLVHTQKAFTNEAGTIKVKRSRRGRVRGKDNETTLRVDCANKAFFVKITSPGDNPMAFRAGRTVKAYRTLIQRIKPFLKNQEYKVRTLQPLIVYETIIHGVKKNLLVSEFVPEGFEVLSKLKKTRDGARAIKFVERVNKEIGGNGLYDLGPLNVFFNPKTKGLIFFDPNA
jgi:hypothetical protein